MHRKDREGRIITEQGAISPEIPGARSIAADGVYVCGKGGKCEGMATTFFCRPVRKVREAAAGIELVDEDTSVIDHCNMRGVEELTCS